MSNPDLKAALDEAFSVAVSAACRPTSTAELRHIFDVLRARVDSVAPTEAAAMAATVPDGWKLVPIRPTPEMIAAADAGDLEYSQRYHGNSNGPMLQQSGEDHWVDMLAAAPQPPVAGQPAEPSPADSTLGQHALNELLELGYTVVNGDLHPPEEGLGKLHCGHPASLMLKSAETGKPLYCELCDAMSGRRDAEAMEAELRQKLSDLSAEVAP